MAQMLTIIVLHLTFLIQIQGQTEVLPCGRLGPGYVPLITNTPQTHHHWPWHAALYHKYHNESDPIYQCGGTVINSKYILTAAHCVCVINTNNPLDTSIITVSLGRLNLDLDNESSCQSFEVAETIVHPKYDSNLKHDIAMIKLSGEATFNDYVQPICLWKSVKIDISEVVGKYGTVVGWGLTEMNQVSKVLRHASLPVVDMFTCLSSNPDVFGSLLSGTNFCAGHLNGTGVCQGDSGGSMTFERNGVYYIRGIVSLSPSKVDEITQDIVCDSWQYALFTDVSHYLPWISDTASIIMECETKVRCKYSFYRVFGENLRCTIDIQRSARNCKIIFDEVPNLSVYWLTIKIGEEFDVVPDLLDAVIKFENLETLTLVGLELKNVERSKLNAFQMHLRYLYLSDNKITQLKANTFDDLNYLETLQLDRNNLNDVHPDLFKELTNLEEIHLNDNQLEIIPQTLFRNNRKLKFIYLQNNKISRVEVDFRISNMPKLLIVNFTGNICVNENCNTIYPIWGCAMNEFHEKLQKNCTNSIEKIVYK